MDYHPFGAQGAAPRSTNIPRPLSNIDQEPAVRNKFATPLALAIFHTGKN